MRVYASQKHVLPLLLLLAGAPPLSAEAAQAGVRQPGRLAAVPRRPPRRPLGRQPLAARMARGRAQAAVAPADRRRLRLGGGGRRPPLHRHLREGDRDRGRARRGHRQGAVAPADRADLRAGGVRLRHPLLGHGRRRPALHHLRHRQALRPQDRRRRDRLVERPAGHLRRRPARFGYAASPLQVDDLLVVDAGGAAGKGIVAFERKPARSSGPRSTAKAPTTPRRC